MNNTVENTKDSTISDIPIVIGMYVQPVIISCEVSQDIAPLGRDRVNAIFLPFVKPIKDIKLPLKNKKIIIVIAFLIFVVNINIPFFFLIYIGHFST